MVDLLAEIRQTIDAVVDSDEKLLLRLRYIEFMKWGGVASIMRFSIRQTTRVHEQALKNIAIFKNLA